MEKTNEKFYKKFCEDYNRNMYEESIDLKSFSYDCGFQLYKNGINNYIIGYQFGLNVASVHSIYCNKNCK